MATEICLERSDGTMISETDCHRYRVRPQPSGRPTSRSGPGLSPCCGALNFGWDKAQGDEPAEKRVGGDGLLDAMIGLL
jgi:hypothetical protein